MLDKSERERQIPHDITYKGNLIYGTNEPIYKKETDPSSRSRVPGGGKVECVSECVLCREKSKSVGIHINIGEEVRVWY